MDDLFGDMFSGRVGGLSKGAGATHQEKGVQLHGRKIDGRYYVRAGDVAELLEANRVLPKAAARLRSADS